MAINSKQLTWQGGDVILSNAATLVNSQNGTFVIALGASSQIALTGTLEGFLQNMGTITHGTGSHYSIAVFKAPVINNATLQALRGDVNLEGGGRNFGEFMIAAGSTIRLNTATYTLTSQSRVSGAGVLEVAGSEHNLEMSYAASSNSSALLVSAGIANMMPGLTFADIDGQLLHITGGTVVFYYGIDNNVPLIVIDDGILDTYEMDHQIQRVTQNGGTFQGIRNVTITDTYLWNGKHFLPFFLFRILAVFFNQKLICCYCF